MRAQEDFCKENKEANIISRSISFMPAPHFMSRFEDYYIKESEKKCFFCRDSYYGYDNSHINEKGFIPAAMRMHQHNIFYGVDADCVGITNAVSWEKNKQWLDVLSKSGTPLFVSIADDAYSVEVKNAIKTAFELAAQNQVTSRAVIEKDKLTPDTWESVAGTDIYKW